MDMNSPAPRTVVVVTGSRADFGLLEPIMHGIAAHPAVTLRTLVTGVHLTTGTWRDIEAAGFEIDARVPMQKPGESGRAADAAAVGRGIQGIAAALVEAAGGNPSAPTGGGKAASIPGIVLVLGDRIEALAGAVAGSVGGWCVAHVHGGDRAEGVADEAMRHAISKLAHLHFAATAVSRRRLVRMGEHEAKVWNVGSPAMDNLRNIQPDERGPRLIVMQHPIGDPDDGEAEHMRGTLRAVVESGRGFRVMAPNADAGDAGVRRAIREMGIEPVEHLPRRVFLSMLAGAEGIVGNSSAGLIEAAGLGVPCVNVGPRQGGRERAGNVLGCDYGEANVAEAVRAALRLRPDPKDHPYGDGHTGERITAVLAAADLAPGAVRKRNSY